MRVPFIPLIATVLLFTGCNTAAGSMVVDDVWGRVSPAAAPNGAFYMTIENKSGQNDTLTQVQAPVCRSTELHESYEQEEGVMGMRPVPGQGIPIAAGETVQLKAGGLHVMCMGKTAEFNRGDRIPLTLVLENAGEIQVVAEIRDQAP